MNKKIILLLSSLSLLTACATKEMSPKIASIQMIDRNGFAETISVQDRLNQYEKVDFFTAQPYQKVLRVYKKDQEGRSYSKLTSYHDNGGIWQYLEAVDGRANGRYLQWHENGKISIEGVVIEGMADLGEMAQKSWLFDGECTVWNKNGDREAHFNYDKGHLDGEAMYFFPSGQLKKTIPYNQGTIHGHVTIYDATGALTEQISYKEGQKEGICFGNWEKGVSRYQEQYREGNLINGVYFDLSGAIVAEVENGSGTKALFEGEHLKTLIEFQGGVPRGTISHFSPTGMLESQFTLIKGKKMGEEWTYYPESSQPKLMVTWSDDKIEGMVKTWYEDGTLESQREMSANKKHGLSFAYYHSGELMLMEEYENNRLVKGSYYKKGEDAPTTFVEEGEGTATLFNAQGHFLKKITYERGKPLLD